MKRSILIGFVGAFLLGQTLSLLYPFVFRFTVLDVVAGITVLAAGLYWLQSRPRARLPVPRVLVWFVAWTVLITAVQALRLAPAEIITGGAYLGRWLVYTALLFVVGVAGEERFWLRILRLSGLGLAVIGFFQYAWYPDLRNLHYLGWDPHYFRLTATLFDPNFAGIVLSLSLCAWVYHWQKERQPDALAASIISAVALYLTYSRSGYVAAATGLAVYGVLSGSPAGKRQLAVPLAILTGLGLLIVGLPKPGGDTLLLTRMGSTLARLDNWQQSVRLFLQAPVTGAGFNFVPYLDSPLAGTGGIARTGGGVDNSFLFVLVTTGLPGLLLYLWYHSRFTRVALRRRDGLGALFVASQSAIAVHSLFVNSQFYPWVLCWYALLAGAVWRGRED